MTRTNWRDTAEILGIAAIVASLIFVGIQLRQDRQIAFAEYAQSTSVIRAEIDIALAEHAEVLAKSNSGIELSENEHSTLVSLTAALWRATQIDYLERGRLGEEAPEFMTDVFAVFLFQNPGARRIWMEDSEEWVRYMGQLNRTSPASIRDLVIDSLETLDRLNGN